MEVKKILIDPHIHTKGISQCSQRTHQQIIQQCLADGTDAIVLTNHCKARYITETGYRSWCELFVLEYEKTYDIGKKNGVKVFFGLEVTSNVLENTDFLLYGITPEQMLQSPQFFNMSQEKLFEYCCFENILLYQAHPFRNRKAPVNPAFLHGVEINCHTIHKSNERNRVADFASVHNLRISCGSDFHGDNYKPYCGMYIDDDINDSVQFARYIEKQQAKLLIHDIINLKE